MGANIRVYGKNCRRERRGKLSGAHVQATDLRASASLVLAALAAEGVSEVHRVYHLDRGYENLNSEMSALVHKSPCKKDHMV